ncbi:hypothetical protein TWF506_010450 [Arthrobotrys conoides]|uniref:Uncharacterized protein n=1 Tax=Arthrobotrys conoides TaxID=74498 RepID=A0AAN8NRI3_9PEZI
MLLLLSLIFILGPFLALCKNESTLATIVTSSTPRPGPQPYSNGPNLKGTPVKITFSRRTNTPSYDDSDDDSGSDIPDDEHPYGPDDHTPLTVYDFFDSTNYRIECVAARFMLSMRPHNNNPYLPASQWPNFRARGGVANQIAAVMSYQDTCKNCHCSPDGVVIHNTNRRSQIHIPHQKRCNTFLIAQICRTAVGCYCTATLVQPTDIPLTISDAEIQNTLDEIPRGIKKAHEGYVYRHGNGKEFGFTPFDLDPNFILTDTELSLRNGDSPAPPSKMSYSGNRQYLVPGTKEPYYLEGPDSEDSLNSIRARYGSPDLGFLGYKQHSKRDVSGGSSDLGVSVWDESRVLEKRPKYQVSPATKGHSAPEYNTEEPTKTVEF